MKNKTIKEVDTLSLMVLFDKENNKKKIAEQIKNKLKKEYDKEKQEEYYIGKYGQYSFYYNMKFYCLIITLKHNLIINKTETQIQNETVNIIQNYFNINMKQGKVGKLNRIDYKVDYKLKTAEEMLIIQNIMEKATDKIGKNYNKKICNGGFYKIKYSSSGSGYVEIIGYDKGNEMLKAYKNGKVTLAEKNIYKNIFRIELRMKNRRLNYEKRKNGTDKDIINYYDSFIANMFLEKYINKILGKEKFYRMDIAIKKVEDATNITDKKQLSCVNY